MKLLKAKYHVLPYLRLPKEHFIGQTE